MIAQAPCQARYVARRVHYGGNTDTEIIDAESGRRLIRAHGPLEQIGVFLMHGSRFVAGYLVYSGMWYAYALESSERGVPEATFDRAFYEKFIAPHRIDDVELQAQRRAA